jgi:hypothetical protein
MKTPQFMGYGVIEHFEMGKLKPSGVLVQIKFEGGPKHARFRVHAVSAQAFAGVLVGYVVSQTPISMWVVEADDRLEVQIEEVSKP